MEQYCQWPFIYFVNEEHGESEINNADSNLNFWKKAHEIWYVSAVVMLSFYNICCWSTPDQTGRMNDQRTRSSKPFTSGFFQTWHKSRTMHNVQTVLISAQCKIQSFPGCRWNSPIPDVGLCIAGGFRSNKTHPRQRNGQLTNTRSVEPMQADA